MITGLALVIVAGVFGTRACIRTFKKKRTMPGEDSSADHASTTDVEEADSQGCEGYTSYNPSMHMSNMENGMVNGRYMNRHA